MEETSIATSTADPRVTLAATEVQAVAEEGVSNLGVEALTELARASAHRAAEYCGEEGLTDPSTTSSWTRFEACMDELERRVGALAKDLEHAIGERDGAIANAMPDPWEPC